jgi:hypothetical protein
MKDFTRPHDVLDECAYQLAFIADFFTQPIAVNDHVFISDDGAQGLAMFLYEIKTNISHANDVLLTRIRQTEVRP